ncbi:MAG: DUF3501 family protein [Alphaproteobacteria bacterium]
MPRDTFNLTEADIMPMADYTAQRRQIRKDIVAKKKPRRLSLGPHATLYFENWDTMWGQVQEMLYIEKGGDEQLKDELAAYNPLIPKGDELVATFMFEIDDEVRRLNILRGLGGIENHIFIDLGGQRISAVPEDDVERTSADGKTSSVHFFHFLFTAEQKLKFADPKVKVLLGSDHKNYEHLAVMNAETRASLAADFS